MHKDTQKRQYKSKRKGVPVPKLAKHLEHINVMAAGVDVGSKSHFVAVPEGYDTVSVREFKSFTTDLFELANWLEKCGIETVAMESTGVYWIPLYELLESRGFDVRLVDARKVKNVSGWKSSKQFASWLGLCPGNKVSGGKRLSGKSKRTANYAASTLRLAQARFIEAKVP